MPAGYANEGNVVIDINSGNYIDIPVSLSGKNWLWVGLRMITGSIEAGKLTSMPEAAEVAFLYDNGSFMLNSIPAIGSRTPITDRFSIYLS
jgi:hypothetical protein